MPAEPDRAGRSVTAGHSVAFLVGFRNRIAALFNWAYVYFTRRRHAQLIVGDAGPLTEGSAAPQKEAPQLCAGDGDSGRTASGSPSHRPALGSR